MLCRLGPAQEFFEVHHDIFKGPYIMTSLQVSPDVSLREKVEFFWNQFDTELAFYTRVAMLRNVNITKDHEIHIIIRVWSKEKLYRHYIRQAYSKIQEFFFFWDHHPTATAERWELLQKRLIECHFYFWSDVYWVHCIRTIYQLLFKQLTIYQMHECFSPENWISSAITNRVYI